MIILELFFNTISKTLPQVYNVGLNKYVYSKDTMLNFLNWVYTIGSKWKVPG